MEDGNSNGVFSKRIRAGSRRTYFFDVRTTKSNDYYLTITESKKRLDEDGYERHKIFLYKEDFNKFVEGLNETVNHVKNELLPDYDFDEFKERSDDNYSNPGAERTPRPHRTEAGFDPAPYAEPQPARLEEPVAEAISAPVGAGPKVSQETDDLKWD